MSDFGFPVNEFELRCIIHNYLGRTGRQVKYFTNNFPRKEWIRGFLKRNPEVTDLLPILKKVTASNW